MSFAGNHHGPAERETFVVKIFMRESMSDYTLRVPKISLTCR